MHIHIFWDALSPAGLQLPVARAITAIVGLRAIVTENRVRVMGYVEERKQINSQALLDSVQAYKLRHKLTDPVLLVISQDLFKNGHRYVFGLARESVGAAVISAARLGNEFYGRKKSDDDLIDRLSKEGAHEIGHLFGLDHCAEWECIMFRPDTLDELDRKKKGFCDHCRTQLTIRLASEFS
jgi:archaemetzincin